MKEMDLSPRLRAIADQVPHGARLADIGTDHAFLPVRLLLDGHIRSAIASDVNSGPLLRGQDTARACGAEKSISFRLCNGLDGISPEEVDTVVIAGMGGELIARILSGTVWAKEKSLLLQPMSRVPELRQWLTENGCRICRETVVPENGKLYVILSVAAGECEPYTRAELWAGRQRREDISPHRLSYLDDIIRRRERAADGMRRGAFCGEALEREKELLTALRDLREEWIEWQR